MMKKLAYYLTLFAPAVASAHPGHAVTEQIHSLLHGEHLLVLVAIAVAVIATAGIVNRFK